MCSQFSLTQVTGRKKRRGFQHSSGFYSFECYCCCSFKAVKGRPSKGISCQIASSHFLVIFVLKALFDNPVASWALNLILLAWSCLQNYQEYLLGDLRWAEVLFKQLQALLLDFLCLHRYRFEAQRFLFWRFWEEPEELWQICFQEFLIDWHSFDLMWFSRLK